MKYIYCEPYSGFNDTLSQIQKAWEYARATGRALVINTLPYSSMRRHFDEYFTVTDDSLKVFPRLTPPLLKHLEELSTYPKSMQGRLRSYVPVWSEELECVIDSVTQTPLELDFTREYAEDVVVHASAGGYDPVELLGSIQLKKDLARSFAERLKVLGGDYCAVHVRNTDYRTNYKAFFLKLAPFVKGRTLLVCSDDWKCKEVAARMFPESNVISLTEIPQLADGKPLHLTRQTDKDKDNLDMLLDFVGLAGAAELYPAPVDKLGEPGGFGRLVDYLNQRKDIYKHFFLDAALD